MNEEMLNIALRNALVEIKNSLTDINWSFILTNNGAVISSEENTIDQNMAKAASSFQTLAEKAAAIGDIFCTVTGEINVIDKHHYVSSINDLYLVAGLNRNADLVYFRTITGTVLPTVLKVLDSITSPSQTPTPLKSTPPIPYSPIKPTPARPIPSELENEEKDEEEEPANEEYAEGQELEEPKEPEPLELDKPQRMETRGQLENIPSQQLIVDRFSGLMVKADTVQLDAEVLKRWSDLFNVGEVNEVDIETFSGKTARCKTKIINDSKLEGRGLIRIPEKTCQLLDVRRGELVRVKPVVSQESD